jgi:hypothetical protein
MLGSLGVQAVHVRAVCALDTKEEGCETDESEHDDQDAKMKETIIGLTVL